MCVRDHDRTVQKAGVIHPGSSRHLPVAIEGEPCGEDGIVRIFSARMDCSHPCSDGAFSDLQLAFSGDQGRVADLNAPHVGNRIVRAGSAIEGNTEIASPRPGLAQSHRGH